MRVLVCSLLSLLVACSSPTFDKKQQITSDSLEQVVSDGLKNYAINATDCNSERLALIASSKDLVGNLIAQIRIVASSSQSPFSLTTLGSEQIDLMYQILTNDGFSTVVRQTADVLKAFAKNDSIMTSLLAIRDDIVSEPGDRISEIINLIAADPSKQNTLLGAMHSALCDNPTDSDLLSALMTPQVIWELGPNATYLLTSSFTKNLKSLNQTLQTIPVPDELKQFVALVQDMLPKPDICSIENLDTYQKYLSIVLSLLKTPENPKQARPLRSFVNVLFKMYSMNQANQCTGISFDNLGAQSTRNALISTANFLSDEEQGLPSFLKKLKPRA